MAAKGRHAGDYAVGYGRPPKETQFKPGKSGNPKDRPKGSRPVGAILQEIIGRKVSVSEDGKTRKISVIEVMLRRLANDAMRADQNAIKLLLSLVDRYAEEPQAVLQIAELLAEDREILAQYLQEPNSANGNPPAAQPIKSNHEP